jgi:agmatinase
LSFSQALYLLNLAAQRKKLIGFDLVEVSPGVDDWNGNVGARLLFHLCGLLHQAK